MGREGKSPQGPYDAQTTQRRAGVQDRQGLLRSLRARSAPRQHGLALLGAHDMYTPALRFRRVQQVVRRTVYDLPSMTVIPARAGITRSSNLCRLYVRPNSCALKRSPVTPFDSSEAR